MMACTFLFRYFPIVLALLVCSPAAIASRALDAAATVVIFNQRDPDSENLAQYYATRRNIPPQQIVGLDCSLSEEITREDYEKTIAKPLRQLFPKKGWWKMQDDSDGNQTVTHTKIRFVVLIRGIPLKIIPDLTIPPANPATGVPGVIAARNDASVDSELAILGMLTHQLGGIVVNPYFRRFTPILNDPIDPGILLPARLDGPTPLIVRNIIDDSIATEKKGLQGWSYVDARKITTEGLIEGEQWLNNLVISMRAQGLPVIFDNTAPTFPAGYPMSDAAIYYGWYADRADGPFADENFEFRPGAIAVHIHSFSAATLRSTTANWCGPLLARGAAATLGNVYEPYLTLTTNLDVFQDRLMGGFTLAESAYMAQKALSWMGVVIGDPLYRPYASWRDVTTQEINSPTPWQAFRSIVLKAHGNILQAKEPLKSAAEKMKTSMFLEALGAAQFDAKQTMEALASFDNALTLTQDPITIHRLNLEKISTLIALRRMKDAYTLASDEASQCPPGPLQNIFLKLSPSPTPIPSPSSNAPAVSDSPQKNK